jgi:multiple sugar transport system ATP-binding protein
MSTITVEGVRKVYPNGVEAIKGVDLTVGDGEFLVLVGPSGCGKTTLLRLIAGLEPVTEGRILLGDWDMTSAPPQRRDVAMVFQSYALYPHMTVAENLDFGLRLAKTPREERRRRVQEVAKTLGLEELLARKPVALSGGQRQRVAMGRAIVREPQAFLMDEPLSNLDAMLRVSMRAELVRLHQRLGTTTVYVTHDQVEAMTLGHRVAVFRDGLLQQLDAPQELFRHPANLFVAAFIGSPSMNLLEARADGGVVRFGEFSLPLPPQSTIGELPRDLVLGIRPTDFELDEFARPELPRLEVQPDVVENLGSELNIIYRVQAKAARPETQAQRSGSSLEDGRLIADDERAICSAQVQARDELPTGGLLKLAVHTERLHFFDRETGAVLSAAPRVTARHATAGT